MHVHETIHEAYLGALEDVFLNYEYRAAPRGMPVREITDYCFRILRPKPEHIVTCNTVRNDVIKRYTEQETALYNSGSNSVEDFAAASKFWKKIANPNGTINSAYGHLIWKKASLGNPIFEQGNVYRDDKGCAHHPVPADMPKNDEFMRTPWEWCVESLRKDKDTRQALLRFSLPEHHWLGNKDFVCTISGNFLIRNNKLNLSVVMRSNDLMLGLVYDLPWFISLMYKMVDELKDIYPDLKVGHYTHLAHSMHIYERNEQDVLKMLGR